MAQTSQRSQQYPPKVGQTAKRSGTQELHDLQDKAGDTFSEVSDKAKEVAAEAGERVGTMFEEQKRLGARYLSRVVGAADAAAQQLERDSPQAATTLRSVVDQVRDFSQSVENRNASDLIADLQRFARNNPTAFLGVTALIGFGVSRFLKSSTPTPSAPPPLRASATSYPKKRGADGV